MEQATTASLKNKLNDLLFLSKTGDWLHNPGFGRLLERSQADACTFCSNKKQLKWLETTVLGHLCCSASSPDQVGGIVTDFILTLITWVYK